MTKTKKELLNLFQIKNGVTKEKKPLGVGSPAEKFNPMIFGIRIYIYICIYIL